MADQQSWIHLSILATHRFAGLRHNICTRRARRSRACAYLADDDHGPLALQEILLAGCPVVGVRTGAPFIQDGVTGVCVDRLPPGAKCVKNDADEVNLRAFVRAVYAATQMNREGVRASTVEDFGTDRVVGQLLGELEVLRAPSGTDD